MLINKLRNHVFTIVFFVILLGFDVVTKYLVESNIGLYERINVLGSFVQLTKLYNRGGVFGVLQGQMTFFLIISIIVMILLSLFYYFEKNKTAMFCSAMGMVFSGAVGNILDRVSGRPGVVDFVYIGVDSIYRWPAFNVADMAIVCGAILLLIVFYKQEKRSRKEA